MEKSVRIKVPATTANIGPGFDCLGMALDIWNYVEFTITDEKKDQVIITGQGQDVLNTGSDNLIIASAHKYFSYLGKYFGKKALETWLFNHSLPLTLNSGTSISHSADLISSTFFDSIFF